MKQRGKAVSTEEGELFRAALKDVRPIKTRTRTAPAAPKPVRVQSPSPHFPSEPTYNEKPAPSIGGHADAHLRRGRLEPESRLDLHGLTQDAAYRALLGFLLRAQSQGQKLVLVITGKGGVLRGQLPLWLGQPDMRALVGGIDQAHVKHGGAGAFYVLLKKRKSSRAVTA
jgi:DNA-nicking Smr family endonuclease